MILVIFDSYKEYLFKNSFCTPLFYQKTTNTLSTGYWMPHTLLGAGNKKARSDAPKKF